MTTDNPNAINGPALFQRELFEAQAERIHKAIAAQAKLVGQLLRVNRGQDASGVVTGAVSP